MLVGAAVRVAMDAAIIFRKITSHRVSYTALTAKVISVVIALLMGLVVRSKCYRKSNWLCMEKR